MGDSGDRRKRVNRNVRVTIPKMRWREEIRSPRRLRRPVIGELRDLQKDDQQSLLLKINPA